MPSMELFLKQNPVYEEKLLNYNYDINCIDKIIISSNKNYQFDELFEKINNNVIDEIIELSSILDPEYLEYLPLKKESLRKAKNSTVSFYESFFKLQRVPFYIEKQYGPIRIEKTGDNQILKFYL